MVLQGEASDNIDVQTLLNLYKGGKRPALDELISRKLLEIFQRLSFH